jgi:hypothetical protein
VTSKRYKIKYFPKSKVYVVSLVKSVDFCQKLGQQTIAEDEIMASFDVVALFPTIPINFALEFMSDWLLSLNLEDEKRSAFMEIAESCMASNFFTFRKDHYKQTSDTSMGNPISPIIANI